MSVSNVIMLKVLLLAMMLIHQPANSTPKDKLHKSDNTKWAVQKTSTLRLQGSTNVNAFGCDVTGYYQPDTISFSAENALSRMITLKGALEINVSSFNCHNKMLTNDLRKTLNATEYPTFTIRFLSLERSPIIQDTKDFLKGWVEIELAGSRKRFEINYSFIKSGASNIQLDGYRSFSFSDFDITPPNKFGGLIRVNQKFNVNFNLILDPVE